MSTPRVLVVGPHPDDAEFGAGGWLAALAVAGIGTWVATFPPAGDADMTPRDVDMTPRDADMTPGDADRDTPAQSVTDRRMDEAAQAAKILGATFCPQPVTATKYGIIDAIGALIADVEPSVVVTAYGRDSHPWHRAVSRGVTTAVFTSRAPVTGSPAPGPPQLLYMSTYSSVEFVPEVFVDVTTGYGTAVQALRCHVTGLAVTPMLSYQMRLEHQIHGCRASVELAEGFRLSHRFGQDWCERRSILYALLGSRR